MEELERKYIELVLKKCLNFEQSKSLMIHYEFKEHLDFVLKIKEAANKMGIQDVCLHFEDLEAIHDYLKNTDIDKIKVNPLIDRSDWDTYSKKKGALLFFESPALDLMEDIPSAKIKKWLNERSTTTTYYREQVNLHTFPWSIIAVPNQKWAESIFPNDEEALQKLWQYIYQMCMIDKPNPLEAWEKYLTLTNYYKKRLNELKITTMHYTNSLGTDLEVTIPRGNNWQNIDKKDAYGNKIMVNLPSYEIFTSPDYRGTEGIVYSSKPLVYNGCYINNFHLEFRNGQVVSCQAETGQEMLEQLVFKEKNANVLGEVALVSKNSPIAQTGLVFNSTLFDENSACHLALGDGFETCFANYENLSSEDLQARGLNISNVHEDFMIGTDDLNIEAQTIEGKKLIFKNGDFNI